VDYCNWAIYRKWKDDDRRSYNLIAPAVRSEFDIFHSEEQYLYMKGRNATTSATLAGETPWALFTEVEPFRCGYDKCVTYSKSTTDRVACTPEMS